MNPITLDDPFIHFVLWCVVIKCLVDTLENIVYMFKRDDQ